MEELQAETLTTWTEGSEVRRLVQPLKADFTFRLFHREKKTVQLLPVGGSEVTDSSESIVTFSPRYLRCSSLFTFHQDENQTSANVVFGQKHCRSSSSAIDLI